MFLKIKLFEKTTEISGKNSDKNLTFYFSNQSTKLKNIISIFEKNKLVSWVASILYAQYKYVIKSVFGMI